MGISTNLIIADFYYIDRKDTFRLELFDCIVFQYLNKMVLNESQDWAAILIFYSIRQWDGFKIWPYRSNIERWRVERKRKDLKLLRKWHCNLLSE